MIAPMNNPAIAPLNEINNPSIKNIFLINERSSPRFDKVIISLRLSTISIVNVPNKLKAEMSKINPSIK